MFQTFRRFLAALDSLEGRLASIGEGLSELCRVQQEAGPASERLEVLELSRHQFEAMCEGLLLKAEGKLRAANNAEARERALRKSYEHLVDPFPEDGVAPETPAGNTDTHVDVEAGEAQGVQPVHLGVAPSNKTLAQRAKFGVK